MQKKKRLTEQIQAAMQQWHASHSQLPVEEYIAERLISHDMVMPCKVGDIVYVKTKSFVFPIRVLNIAKEEDDDGYRINRKDYTRTSFEIIGAKFGENTFFTREEAQKARQKMQEKKGAKPWES